MTALRRPGEDFSEADKKNFVYLVDDLNNGNDEGASLINFVRKYNLWHRQSYVFV